MSLYRSFRDSVLGPSFLGDMEPKYFRRLALRRCSHGIARRVWDRVRTGYPHPVTHHEVIETYHAEKMWKVKLLGTDALKEPYRG